MLHCFKKADDSIFFMSILVISVNKGYQENKKAPHGCF